MLGFEVLVSGFYFRIVLHIIILHCWYCQKAIVPTCLL